MKTFPTIVLAVFAALAIIAAIIFARYSSSGSNSIGTVVIWGAIPKDAVTQVLGNLGQNNSDYGNVSYRQVPAGSLVSGLTEAIASGAAPDLIILPEEDLLSNEGKLQQISYATLSRRDFQNTYIQATENFLADQGTYGIPLTVNPLVMYWNRSLFASAGLPKPPAYWDELADMAPKLTKSSQGGTLSQSAVSFGGWANVTHAKEILLTLLSQLGNPVVAANGTGGFQSVLGNGNGGATLPADSALTFYTDFANPAKPNYSWNSSEPASADAFVGGQLAVYFGFASELAGIRAANPNLNFDVAPIPAIRGGGAGAYAEVTALAVPRGAQNPSGAITVAEALSSQASQVTLSSILGTPSVRRDTTPQSAADPYSVVFWNASLTAFSFLDPDPSATDAILSRMVGNVTSGRLQVTESTRSAAADIQALFKAQ